MSEAESKKNDNARTPLIHLSPDPEINYALNLIKEINTAPANKGKLSGKFNRSINNLNNQQLIVIADYLSKIISDNKGDTNLLEDMMDNVLEKIEGSLS
jgi:hypothetical protein